MLEVRGGVDCKGENENRYEAITSGAITVPVKGLLSFYFFQTSWVFQREYKTQPLRVRVAEGQYRSVDGVG